MRATSAAVSAPAPVPPRGGKRSESAESTSVKAPSAANAPPAGRYPEAGVPNATPARTVASAYPATANSSPATVANGGARAGSAARDSESTKRKVLPSAVMRSPRMSAGAPKPLAPPTAMSSSRSSSRSVTTRSSP